MATTHNSGQQPPVIIGLIWSRRRINRWHACCMRT